MSKIYKGHNFGNITMSEGLESGYEERPRTFVYQGNVIGETHFDDRGGEFFVPRVNADEVAELIQDMSPVERIHLADSFPGLAMAAHYYGFDERSYVGDADIAERVLNLGCKDTQELRVADFRTYILAAQRNLSKEIFPKPRSIDDIKGN